MGGIIVIDKEKDFTSRDVVNIISKNIGTKKVGHTGTLDPLATGVLVVAFGVGTKVIEYLMSDDKEYVATVQIGVETDTLDIEGEVLKENNKQIIDQGKLEKVIKSYQKTYKQQVPKYSAVSVNGKRLYHYARNNEEVILPEKEVTIKSIKLLETTDKTFSFSCTVTKGTYIRSLIRDILVDLDLIGTMSSLRRTRQGNFTLECATKVKDNNYHILDIKEALSFPKLVVDDDIKRKVLNGVAIPNNDNYENLVMILDQEENLIAIYKNKDNILKAEKVFN